MGMISQTTLEQIRAASDIVEIIGASLPLKRAGANFVTLCPFHKEKTPSFNVNPHRQIFHCFGCHKGGDVFTFIKEYENLSFVEAVERLAERARIPLEFERNAEGRQTRSLKDALLQIHQHVLFVLLVTQLVLQLPCYELLVNFQDIIELGKHDLLETQKHTSLSQ